MLDKIPGDLHIANDVLADIAGKAALECYGVVGMSSPDVADGFAKLLPNSRLRRGVKVSQSETGARIDLFVIIEHGTNIAAVSQNLVDAVSFAITSYAGVTIDGVEVHVQGVRVRD